MTFVTDADLRILDRLASRKGSTLSAVVYDALAAALQFPHRSAPKR